MPSLIFVKTFLLVFFSLRGNLSISLIITGTGGNKYHAFLRTTGCSKWVLSATKFLKEISKTHCSGKILFYCTNRKGRLREFKLSLSRRLSPVAAFFFTGIFHTSHGHEDGTILPTFLRSILCYFLIYLYST